MIEAAVELFLEQGYGPTTIDQIAQAADVSPQSVYASFDGKAGILEHAVHLLRTGDPAGRTRDSEAARGVTEIADLRERARASAALTRAVHEPSAAVIAIVERASATDPALADLHDRLRIQRRESVAHTTDNVPAKAFRKGITKSEATDALTYLCAAHSYTELVDGMGWTPDRYERWLGDTIYQMLFAD
ncbi:MAG: TetR/AcrR family transcriptional regulator [Acidimicrobiales bacterium]